MSRKAFLIWGLSLIHAQVLGVFAVMYLAFSHVLTAAQMTNICMLSILTLILAFGILLWKRFDETGATKWALALCAVFYVLSFIPASHLAAFLSEQFLHGSGAQSRFFSAIGEHSRAGHTTGSPWTSKQKIDYILALLPSYYAGHLGLFALLWFGSLDPRTPRKPKPNRTPLRSITPQGRAC